MKIVLEHLNDFQASSAVVIYTDDGDFYTAVRINEGMSYDDLALAFDVFAANIRKMKDQLK